MSLRWVHSHFVGFVMRRLSYTYVPGTSFSLFKPSHKIMALFVLCKLILQTRMRSHPVGLDV